MTRFFLTIRRIVKAVKKPLVNRLNDAAHH